MQGKVLYVWFDAPIGYISATRQWAIGQKKTGNPTGMMRIQAGAFYRQDNIVFHCIIFPIMLKLHGNILPDNVPANEFLNLEGDKDEYQPNWKLDARLYQRFCETGKRRWSVCRHAAVLPDPDRPETKDSEFTWKGFRMR